MKTKNPPKFFGITLDKTLDSVTGRFLKTGDYIMDSCDDDDIASEILGFVRCCTDAIVDSYIEIMETEKNDGVDLDELALEVRMSTDALASFTDKLMTIARMPNDGKLARLNSLLKDIHYFDDSYIAELRNY